MVSFRHEILVDLFRENGQLAPGLLRACAGIAIDHERIERGSIDLSQVVPTEYRADNVAILHGRDGRPVTGVIVEVQRKRDRGKQLSWPVYVTTLRAKLRCPAVLLVVAPSPAVAAWHGSRSTWAIFTGPDAGGKRAAVAYTILGSCRISGVNPVEYLGDVLPRLTRRIRLIDLPALLPSRWKAAQAAAAG